MYLRPPVYGYAINCHLVFLEIPGTRLLCMKKQNLIILIIEGEPEIQKLEKSGRKVAEF